MDLVCQSPAGVCGIRGALTLTPSPPSIRSPEKVEPLARTRLPASGSTSTTLLAVCRSAGGPVPSPPVAIALSLLWSRTRWHSTQGYKNHIVSALVKSGIPSRTYILPDGEGLGEVNLHAQGPIVVVFRHLLGISIAQSEACGRRTPLTGFAPNSSGKMPKRRSSPWQFGARWSAAPTSSANSDRSKSCEVVLAGTDPYDFYVETLGVAHCHLVALPSQTDGCH